MAGRRKNGEGTWGKKKIKGVEYEYYRDATGDYTYGKTTKEVKEKLKVKNEKKKSSVQKINENNLYTFGEYATYWVKIKKIEIQDGSFDDYEDIIRVRIVEYKKYDLAGKQLKSLTFDMFQDYINMLTTHYSLGTIKKTWGIIKQIIRYGETIGDIEKGLYAQICELVKLPTEEKVAVKERDIQVITEEDMELLYQESFRKYPNAERKMYGNAAQVLVLIMYSGLRISEACALKWFNVDMDNNTITITNSIKKIKLRDKDGNVLKNDDGTTKYKIITKKPKTKSGEREIPIPSRGMEMLKYFESLNPNHNDKDFVCINSLGNHFMKREPERCLSRMLKRSNCSNKEYTPHSLRHGYGSFLISKGADIKLVSELLGHKDVTTTYNIYIKIFKKDKTKAVALFDQKEDDDETSNTEN